MKTTVTKTVETDRRMVKATTHNKFIVDGQFVAIGSIVEIAELDADSLLSRNLAVAATPAEVDDAGKDIIRAKTFGEKWKDAA